MVRRDVHAHADVRPEAVDGFELEAGELEDVPLVRARAGDHGRHRLSDVAAHLHGNAGLPEDVAGQRGRGRFSVGPGDADGVPLEKPARQFDLAQHGDAVPAGVLEFVDVGRHARRDHDGVRAVERLRGLRREGDAQPLQRLRDAFHLGQRLQVHRPHARSPRRQELGHGQPRGGQPRHHHVLSRKFQRCTYLNFKVVSANSAITSPAIQNRTMIFDSVQPSASK